MKEEATATTLQLVGAGCFGLVIGWFLYYLNRYRKEVAISDLASVVTAVGAGAVLALFPAKTDLFAAYAIGLAAGFFAYLLVLLAFAKAAGVSVKWFLGVPIPGASDPNRPMLENESLNAPDPNRLMPADEPLNAPADAQLKPADQRLNE